jgi:DNA polymerase-3 subunit epsilon
VKRIPRAAATTPWNQAEYCVLDVETTGLDPASDNIISFGAVPIAESRILPSKAVSVLIKPLRPVQPDSVKIHALRNCDLQDQPTLQDLRADIEAVVAGRYLVAHSAWLDSAFLTKAFKGRASPFRQPMIDTAQLVRQSLDCPPTGRADISLEYSATMLGLPVHDPHTALGDAMTTAQIFLALAHRLSTNRPVTVAELISRSMAPTTVWQKISRHRP